MNAQLICTLILYVIFMEWTFYQMVEYSRQIAYAGLQVNAEKRMSSGHLLTGHIRTQKMTASNSQDTKQYLIPIRQRSSQCTALFFRLDSMLHRRGIYVTSLRKG